MVSVTDSHSAEPGNPEGLVIVGGTIIDGTGAAPVEDGAILIHGKRITAIGDGSLAIPPRATRIDARGKFVIPGLMYPCNYLISHAWPADLLRCENRYDEVAIEAAQLSLKGGVTTVFEWTCPPEAVIKARDAINEGRVSGARIFVSGSCIGLGGPFSADLCDHGDENVGERSSERKLQPLISAADPAFRARVNALWVTNVGEELTRMRLEEVRQEVRKYVQSGVDYVTYVVNCHKLGAYQYPAFSARIQRMIVEEAHREGLPVATFSAASEEGAYQALDAGVDILQPSPLGDQRTLSAEMVALIARRETFVHIISHPAEAVEWYRRQPANALYPGIVKAQLECQVNDRNLIRAGARIISAGFSVTVSPDCLAVLKVGSPPEGYQPHGEGHIRGLRGLLDNGMSPMDALMAATRNIAQAFKVDKDLGTLERGKLADLVILDKNPLESEQNYRAIHLVMKEGKAVDRDALPTQKLISG